MSEWMDKVPKELTFVCSDLQEQIQRTIDEAQTELRTHLMVVMDKKVELLEAQYNEVQQETTSTL